MSTNPVYILPREWLALGVVFATLTLLTILSFRTTQQELKFEKPHFLSDPYTEILLEGAFENSGKVRVLKETTFEELFQKHALLPTADTKKIDQNRKIRPNQTIRVPIKKYLKIHFRGFFEASISLPHGSKLIDLISLLIPFSEIDLAPLLKKRRLKPDEIIALHRLHHP